MTTPVDRRSQPRFGIDLPVRLVLAPDLRRLEAVVVDVSRGGLFIGTAAPASLGRRVSVNFFHRSRQCEANGHVVRCQAGDGFAVQCFGSNLAFMEFLAELAAAPPEARAEVLAEVKHPEIHVLDLP